MFKRFMPTVALMLCMAFLLSGCGFFKKKAPEVNMEKINKSVADAVDEAQNAIDNTMRQAKDIVKETVKAQIEPRQAFGKDAITLVFFGLDKTEERETTLGSFRTDTIIVMRIDFASHKIIMLSIPRDTYVTIANKGRQDKINHAFPFGGGIKGDGFANSIATVENFLGGIKIDHYFGMDMEVIAPIIDAIGGVQYDVDVEYHKNGFDLSKGVQVLNGQKAQQYLRFRYSPMGDIDRVKRQQRFLLAMKDDLKRKMASKQLSVEQLMDVYKTVQEMTYTDMNIQQLMSLGYFMADANEPSIDTYIVEGWFMNKNGISYWKPDMEQVNEVVERMFPASSATPQQ
jgi:LCP family protein required for cell wall assembly